MPVISRTAVVVASVLATACAGEGRHDDHHEDGRAPRVETTRAALVAGDPLSAAVAESCTTSIVVGLSTQLVEEIQCLRPGVLKRIDGIAGLALGSAVFPYLQTPAADALVKAQKARGVTMSINSALRSLAQQYLLYRWYETGRCEISLAASPGGSNHESALAVDIEDNAGWRPTMTNAEFRWLGANDPVHFDYIGAGRIELGGLSVLAFQRLWNRNHPEDRIEEDGEYGPATEERLSKSPIGGFGKGADCTQPAPAVDAGPPRDVPTVPDATELPRKDEPASEGGCAVGRSPSAPFSTVFALVLLALRRWRRSW